MICHPYCSNNMSENCDPLSSKLDTPVLPPLAKRQKRNTRNSVVVDEPPKECESSQNEQSQNITCSPVNATISKFSEVTENLRPCAKKKLQNIESVAAGGKSPKQQKSSGKNQKGDMGIQKRGGVCANLDLNSEKTETIQGKIMPPLVKRHRQTTKKGQPLAKVLPKLRSASKKFQAKAEALELVHKSGIEDSDVEMMGVDLPQQLSVANGREMADQFESSRIIKCEKTTSLWYT